MKKGPFLSLNLYEVKSRLRNYLKIGKKYRLDRSKLFRKSGEKDEVDYEWNERAATLTCTGIYSNHIVFTDSKGRNESFTYMDAYKIIFGLEEEDNDV